MKFPKHGLIMPVETFFLIIMLAVVIGFLSGVVITRGIDYLRGAIG